MMIYNYLLITKTLHWRTTIKLTNSYNPSVNGQSKVVFEHRLLLNTGHFSKFTIEMSILDHEIVTLEAE